MDSNSLLVTALPVRTLDQLLRGDERNVPFFPDAYAWRLAYADEGKISPEGQERIRIDCGRWLWLGLVAGRKPARPQRGRQ